MKSILAFIFATTILTGAGLGQTSSFNYQGRLTGTGAAATGTYLFQCRLHDSPVGGSQVGGTLSDVSVNVTDGSFSANLDFGAAAYSGAERYLDISVRKTAGDTYTTLTPRQRISSAPYATRFAKAARATGTEASARLSAKHEKR